MSFRQYEIDAIKMLVGDRLDDGLLETIFAVENLDIEVTGVGYFATAANGDLPSGRLVFDKPVVVGSADGVEVGFVVFVEDQELTLECHGWGQEVQAGFRDADVSIRRVEG